MNNVRMKDAGVLDERNVYLARISFWEMIAFKIAPLQGKYASIKGFMCNEIFQ